MSGDRTSWTVSDWARLARIEIPEEERAGLEADLERIVGWIGALGEAGVAAAGRSVSSPALSDGLLARSDADAPPVERPDRIQPSLPQDDAIAEAASSHGGYLVVPRVVDRSGDDANHDPHRFGRDA